MMPKYNNALYVFMKVKKRDGSYIDVPYMKDVVLMNMGALLQRLTSDRYWAAVRLILLF